MLSGLNVLIIGGTGSLGKRLVRRIMTGEMGKPNKIIIMSRDEAKQHDMRVEWKNLSTATHELFYRDYQDVLSFRIGDVRNYNSVYTAMKDCHVVINAAAMKQVPACEYFPSQAVQTNIQGAQNIVTAIRSEALNTRLVVDVSTDKACKPINTYGMTKAIQERIILEANRDCPLTRFVCVRYGNVMASRGSVIPLFQNLINHGGPTTITTEDMTRFMMSLDQAVDTIFGAMKHGAPGDTFIPIVPSANMIDLASVMIGERDIEIKVIGIRPGEKIDEILISEEEVYRTSKCKDFYVIKSILPEIHKDEIVPVLEKEMSSKDYLITKDELKELLTKEGHLNF